MNTISRWTKGVRGKLLVLLLVPTFLIVGVLFYVGYSMGRLKDSVVFANEVRGPLIQYSMDMDSAVNGIMRWMWTSYVDVLNPEMRDKTLSYMKQEMARYEENEKLYLALPRPEKLKEIYKTVEENWPGARAAMDEVAAHLSKGTEKDAAEARKVILEKIRKPLLTISQAFKKIGDIRLEAMKKDAAEERTMAEQSIIIMDWVGVCGVIFLIAFGIYTANRLVTILARITNEIDSASSQVEKASNQLSTASQQVASGATEAASSLEETVASLEELSSMVRVSSENSKQAAELSGSGEKIASSGSREIQTLITSINEIATGSKKIEEITNVIDDIAFQTNLLALNAAVEAARAGEQGKGFAVVAEAVRNLAQRSAVAAKDINGLIKESVSKITEGTKIAGTSEKVLQDIVDAVKKVSSLNSEVASTSNEQSSGIGQISKAMNELDSATQQNAAASEEVAASSEELSAQAVLLKKLVADLTLVVEGVQSSYNEGYSSYTAEASRSTPGTGGGGFKKMLKFGAAKSSNGVTDHGHDASKVA